MGTMTLAEMREEVHQGLLDRTDYDPTTQAANYARWLNQAYLHVSDPRIHRHKELLTSEDEPLVAGTRTYNLATGITRYWATHHVIYVDTSVTPNYNRRLQQISLRELDDRSHPDGPPDSFAMLGVQLHLDRTPTATEAGRPLRIRYWQQPALLSANGDVTVLNQVWDLVIVHGAIFYAWLGLHVAERADFARETFGSLINEIGQRDRLEAEDEGFRVRIALQDYQRP